LATAIDSLIPLVIREPLVLPTFYSASASKGASVIACETTAFWNRGYTDLTDTVNLLRGLTTLNPSVQSKALTSLVFFEHVLEFYESLQILTQYVSPTGTLTNALALMVGTGAQSPFLPYSVNDQTLTKDVGTAILGLNQTAIFQKSVTGLQARLYRSSIAFNVDPELHRMNNIPDELVWHIKFVGVEYMKQYGYRNANGVVQFNLSDEKVILESNILNLWNYNPNPQY